MSYKPKPKKIAILPAMEVPAPPDDPRTTLFTSLGVSVTVHSKRNRGGLIHELRYWHQKKPVSLSRSNWNEIYAEVLKAVALLQNGCADSAILEGKDLYIYQKALENIKATGFSLDEATSLLSEVIKKAGRRSPLSVIEHYNELFPVEFPDVEVLVAANAWLDAKEDDIGVVRQTWNSYKASILPFAREVGGMLHDLTEKKIQDYVEGYSLDAETRNTQRGIIINCLNWCISEKKMSARQLVFDSIPTYGGQKRRKAPIKFYSAAEFCRIMESLPPLIALVVALMAFGGIRLEEVMRLQWEDFRWFARTIVVSPVVSKTGEDRTIRINDTLWKFLLPWRGCKGPVCFWALGAVKKYIKDSIVALGITYIKNGPRHCFGTFFCALTDISTTADQMGNSPEIIKKHYKGLLVDPAEIPVYWAIFPSPKNMVYPKRLTENNWRYYVKRRVVSLWVELAEREGLLPSRKKAPEARAAKIAAIEAKALEFIKDAPFPKSCPPSEA